MTSAVVLKPGCPLETSEGLLKPPQWYADKPVLGEGLICDLYYLPVAMGEMLQGG